MKFKRIYIEITNTCNLKCAFCDKNNRTPKALSCKEFEHILKQVKSYTDYIYLHVQGEPLTHPFFDNILDLTDLYQMHVQLVTNGTFLKEHMNLLDHPSIRKVSFSLQSIEYQTIDVEEYMQTILIFIEQFKEKENTYAEIRFWRNDQYEYSKTAKCISLLKEKYQFIETKKQNSFKIMNNVYVDFDNMFSWPEKEDNNTTNFGKCLGGIQQLAILSSGNVIPCCLDANGEITFGNIFETSLDAILQNKRYQDLVNGFRKHMIVEDLCKHCTYRYRFSEHK